MSPEEKRGAGGPRERRPHRLRPWAGAARDGLCLLSTVSLVVAAGRIKVTLNLPKED